MHKDIYNDAFPNLVVALSEFTHGEIWQEDPSGPVYRSVQGAPRAGVLLDVAKAPVVLQAHSCFHATEPWEGNRVVLVGFSVRHVQDLPPKHQLLLTQLGFRWQLSSVAAGAEGVASSEPSIPPDPSAVGKRAASDETVARSPQEPGSVGKRSASGETVGRSAGGPLPEGRSARANDPEYQAAIAEEFGPNKLLVSAMGAIEKTNGDIRPIHDGTHGVHLNGSIRVLDRLEVPGPDEILECVAVSQETREAVFGISADISSAHRLVSIRRADWPKLGCRARSSDRVVWMNTVGTFGISSAAYRWTRLFGCVGRWVMRLMMTLWAMQMIYVDDLHLVAAGPQKYLVIWMMIAAYEAVGTPFAYRKFRGGLRIDFIGYHLSYECWAAGLSQKRCEWVTDWIDRAEANGWMVLGRHFIELAGRLAFVGQVLRWMKPFLAPLHSWAAVLARGTVARMPLLVHVSLLYIRKQLLKGRRLLQPALAPRPKAQQSFRTDAKCADGFVVLGGWDLSGGNETSGAPWFCLKLLPGDAPWLFKEDGSSQWASTAAEFLGTMVALKAFGWLESGAQAREWTTLIYAGTDNRANPQALRKGGSVTWPLMGLMMQMADSLVDIGGKLRLEWRPREENQEADNLTNEIFDGFDPRKRVMIQLVDVPLDLFLSLQNAYAEFDQKRKEFKMVNPRRVRTSKKVKLSEKTPW